MRSMFPEGPSGAQEALFPVSAHLPSEEQVCCSCGALKQADGFSLLGLVLCPCPPAFPDAQLGMVSWECFAFAWASPRGSALHGGSRTAVPLVALPGVWFQIRVLAHGAVEEQWLFGPLKQSHTSLWTLPCQCNVGFCERLLCRM